MGWYVHTASVETYAGDGAYGPAYDAPVPVACLIDSTTQFTVTAQGEQVTSRATKLFTALAHQGLFAENSRVTSALLGGDGVARVVAVAAVSSGSLGLGLDHLEVSLI
jgi:hypothetical protein